jgi:hypothetical protein
LATNLEHPLHDFTGGSVCFLRLRFEDADRGNRLVSKIEDRTGDKAGLRFQNGNEITLRGFVDLGRAPGSIVFAYRNEHFFLPERSLTRRKRAYLAAIVGFLAMALLSAVFMPDAA